jgi:hypothetical protein
MADTIADDIRHLRSLLNQALERVRLINEQQRELAPGFPSCIVVTEPTEEVPDPISQLLVCLDRASGAAGELFQRLCARPTDLHLRGFLLSREEFYLLASQDFVCVAGPWGDAYEVFQMFHYEDSMRRCYINPDEGPRVGGTIKVRLGVPPEEISWHRLRPEQREFFDRHLPEIAARFRREV